MKWAKNGKPLLLLFLKKNEGKVYGVQLSQWSNSILTSIKVLNDHFSPALTVFEIFTFQNSWPENEDQDHYVQHSFAVALNLEYRIAEPSPASKTVIGWNIWPSTSWSKS